ncbi:hypothetical protein TrCOL_g11133 [Triparma columacea]|uniref:Uncharacterized protein n=1 Tax=Triparma columacea TaxID=722753 RepID=A0A9W7LDY7_9STRA|nr:hypothetical protein TrCOL_g11133 [Triparma columacea]
MLRTLALLGRRGGNSAFTPKKSTKHTRRRRAAKTGPKLSVRRGVKGEHSEPMSVRREMNAEMDVEAFESFKVKGKDFNLPMITNGLGEEKWKGEVYDELVREILYGVRPEVGEGEASRYRDLVLKSGLEVEMLGVGEEGSKIGTGGAVAGASGGPPALVEGIDSGIMRKEGRRVLDKHCGSIIENLKKGDDSKLEAAVKTTASVVKHELIKHYGAGGRKGRVGEVLGFLGVNLKLPEEIFKEIIRQEDVVTGVSMVVGGGGLNGLEEVGGIANWVWNQDYKGRGSEELIEMWEGRLERAKEVGEEGAIDAAVSFGYKILGKDPRNLEWVRNSIVLNRNIRELSTGDEGEMLGLQKLDLRCCSYKGEGERAINVLNEIVPEVRDEACYSEVFNAIRMSVRYDHTEISKDPSLAQYYAKMIREVVDMMGEEDGFNVYGPGVWRSVVGAVGGMGDWDTAKAIIKAREVTMRDYCNEEIGANSEGEASALVSIDPSSPGFLGPGVVGWSSSDYASAISATLTSPIINNAYGVLSDDVCIRNALVTSMEQPYEGVNTQSVPGMTGMETAVASMDWDVWDDKGGEGRSNRGKLKRKRFEGIRQEDDLGTGRWPIAEGWKIDEVIGKERWEEKERVKELVGAEGGKVTWEEAMGEGEDDDINIKMIEQQLRKEYMGRESELAISGGGDLELSEEDIERALSLSNEWEDTEDEEGEDGGFLMERSDALEVGGGGGGGNGSELVKVEDPFNPRPTIERVREVKEENDGMFGNGSLSSKVAACRSPGEIGMDARSVALARNVEAMELLEEAVREGKATTVVMNAALASIERTGKIRTALAFYGERYGEVGVEKNERTHRCIIRMLLKNKRLEEANKVKEAVLWEGGTLDVDTHGMLVHYHGSRGNLEEGIRELEECVRLRGVAPKERHVGVLRGAAIRGGLMDRDGEVNVEAIVGRGGGKGGGGGQRMSKNVMLREVQRARKYEGLEGADKRYYDTLKMIGPDPKGWIKRGMGRGYKRNMGKAWARKGWEIRNKGLK